MSTTDPWPRIRALADAALDQPVEQRAAFLDAACAGDADLLRRVLETMSLMEDSESALDTFLVGPTIDEVWGALDSDQRACAGLDRIGAYRIVRLLGSGGMGNVYEAEQETTHRAVAIKLLHHGIENPSALRSFRVEAAALARFHHPGIAHIYDTGTVVEAAAGRRRRPFLVVEYIPGARTLTRYCAEQRLSTTQRVRLFMGALDAVQYGHEKGVIHRDLKPANVLVDEAGRVKVIDYGVARACRAAAQDGAWSEPGPCAGTPRFMPPEQRNGDVDDVDVRSDVFSLGATLHAVLHCEADTDGDHGHATLPAPLDWVIAKAMNHDRDRRYPSVAALHEDLSRFLAIEPVSAAPPSHLYRLRCFARRHRAWVGAALIVALTLVVSLITVGLALERESRLRAHAEQESARVRMIVEFLMGMFRGIDPNQFGINVRVRDILDDATRELDTAHDMDAETEVLLRECLGEAYSHVDLPDQAEHHLRQRYEALLRRFGPNQRDTAVAARDLAICELRRGQIAEAGQRIAQSAAVLERICGSDSEEYLCALAVRAGVAHAAGDDALAAQVARDILATRTRAHGPGNRDTLIALGNLAAYERAIGSEAPRPLLTDGYARARATLGETHTVTLQLGSALAALEKESGHLDAALQLYRELCRIHHCLYEANHAATINMDANLATVYSARGDTDIAETLFRDALLRCDGASNLANRTLIHNNLASLLLRQGRIDEALAEYQTAIDSLNEQHPEALGLFGLMYRNLGLACSHAGRLPEAAAALLRSREYYQQVQGPDGPNTRQVDQLLIDLRSVPTPPLDE